MKTRLLVAAISVCLLAASACASSDSCPRTIEDENTVDGMDVAVPAWLPPGFPLPDGIILYHTSDGTEGGPSLLTGFIPDGDADTTVEDIGFDLVASGYEMLVSTGFASRGFVSIVALDDELELLVTVDAASADMPVRNDAGDCPLAPGTQVGIVVTEAVPADARALYADAFIGRGTAHAVIGADEYDSAGECYLVADTYTFSSLSGDQVGLSIGRSDSGVIGDANAGPRDNSQIFSLDTDAVSGTEPLFGWTQAGFHVEGGFIDAIGDLGIVSGRIDVACDRP